MDGNGQAELIDAIAGLRAPDVRHGSSPTGGTSPARAPHDVLEAGVGHIPTDRQHRGLVMDFSLAENIALHDFDKPPAVAARVDVPAPGRGGRARRCWPSSTCAAADAKAPASSLSGGNQQKVIIAREISRDPAVLVASQPTRGIDVGAIEYVHQRLIAERDEGRAILLVSLELEEVLSLSDRILVIFEGRIVAEFAPGVGREELGEAMLGIGADR